MGSTPNRAIPYVEPSGQLNAYPATMKSQSERLDELLYDTGWVPLTVNAGFAVQSGWTPQVRRIGSAVYARGGVSSAGITAGGTQAVFTIPAGFRAVGCQWAGRAGTSTGAAAATWITNAAGTISLICNSTLSSYYLLPGPVWFID